MQCDGFNRVTLYSCVNIHMLLHHMFQRGLELH